MSETEAGLVLSQPLPGSRAQELGLEAGDILLFFDRAAVRLRVEAAAAWRAWIPGARLSAVARRGERLLVLESRDASLEPSFKRALGELSAQENALKADRLQTAGRQAAASLAQAPIQEVQIPKRQAVWIRFPDGIPWQAAAGDVLIGETCAGVPTSARLDRLALPPRSKVWAKVAASQGTLETRHLRLLLYRIRPAGGRDYAMSATFTDLVSPLKTEKMTASGTLVVATPLSAERKRAHLLGPLTQLKAVLHEPLTLSEPPSFYKAGPGLWLASTDSAGFSIAKVAPGGPADKAGLKPGQKVLELEGRAASKLTFIEALDRVFGDPARPLRLAVESDGKRLAIELPRS